MISPSGAGATVPPTHPRPGRGVAAVAGFGQGVGSEVDADLGVHDVVDDRRIGPFIEVVDELGPLIAEESSVLEA